MKKSIILVLVLLAVLTGCESNEALPSPAPSPTVGIAEESPEPVAAAEAYEKAEVSESAIETALDPLDILLYGKTSQYCTTDPIPEDDLNTILQAGLNAPSAVNYQPWHFSVITDTELLQELGNEVLKLREYKDLCRFNLWNAQAAVLISTTDYLTTDGFDCGVAAQSMSIAARLLGYGTKFLGHPNLVLNGDDCEYYKELFKIPDDHTAIAILIIGMPDESVDAVSSASTRRSFEESVTFID